MKPPVDNVRISKQGLDQLTKLKRITGIEHRNTLCRWALCYSLREETPPPKYDLKMDGGTEIPWKIFASNEEELYASLIRIRSIKDDTSEQVCLRSHLHRGLGYLASKKTFLEILGET